LESSNNAATLVNMYDNEKLTPAHDAVEYGHLNCLKTLLQYGANIKAKDMDGHSPYSLALSQGPTSTINQFIQSLHAYDSHSAPPLLYQYTGYSTPLLRTA
ncbi:ankyrin repeat domain-containing protein, partial [Salmonella sp. s51228]|uniref:ankyrin repeat domain-containing protein n=1 Tax=Salmonella sp. s51228 TaxID=3159652 RepID=UPI00397F82CE